MRSEFDLHLLSHSLHKEYLDCACRERPVLVSRCSLCILHSCAIQAVHTLEIEEIDCLSQTLRSPSMTGPVLLQAWAITNVVCTRNAQQGLPE